jgi:hypothetical protein
MPIKFQASRNTIVHGASGAGKTEFILEVIRQRLVHPWPANVYYMFGVEQDFMREWNNVESQPIKFIKGLDFSQMDTSQPSLLCIDDLILSGKNKEVAEIFVLGSHHKQISVFYLTQNLFPKCPLFRLMSSNSHYLLSFHSQRNTRQVHTLARQIYTGKNVDRIMNAYLKASQRPRGFILLTFAPDLPEELTVITDFWEWLPSVYL